MLDKIVAIPEKISNPKITTSHKKVAEENIIMLYLLLKITIALNEQRWLSLLG